MEIDRCPDGCPMVSSSEMICLIWWIFHIGVYTPLSIYMNYSELIRTDKLIVYVPSGNQPSKSWQNKSDLKYRAEPAYRCLKYFFCWISWSIATARKGIWGTPTGPLGHPEVGHCWLRWPATKMSAGVLLLKLMVRHSHRSGEVVKTMVHMVQLQMMAANLGWRMDDLYRSLSKDSLESITSLILWLTPGASLMLQFTCTTLLFWQKLSTTW